MKRLLYVNKRADMSGAPLHILQLMRHARGQYDVHLCVGELGFLSAEAERLQVPVHLLTSMGQSATPLQLIRMIIDLRRKIRDLKPDLVHVHAPLAGVACRIACALERIPCIFTAHGWNFAPGLSIGRRISSFILEWLVGKLGQPVIAVSEYNKNLAVRFKVVNEKQVYLIHNGIASNALRVINSRGNLKPVVIMVARFDQGKKQTDLILALSRVQHDCQLVLVGDGPTRAKAESLAARLGLSTRTRFLGRRDDVPELLSQADIFVLASDYEGLPLSILEAMRAGLPVIASNVGGVSECVLHGRTGFVVRQSDVVELGIKLDELLRNSEMRITMGNSGREYFSEKFCESKMLDDTALLYKRFVKLNS